LYADISESYDAFPFFVMHNLGTIIFASSLLCCRLFGLFEGVDAESIAAWDA
jgi:hypothetical protein